MHAGMQQILKVPQHLIHSVPYRAPVKLEIPDTGVPPQMPPVDAPEHLQVQRLMKVRVRVFNLSNDTDRDEYEKVWQSIGTGESLLAEHKTDFVPANGSYVALLRWAELSHKIPEPPVTAVQPR